MPTTPRPPPLVLVVDDHADTRLMLTELLELCGCRVIACATGTDALRCASLSHPDVIITELMTPGIDGIELCRRVRQDPAMRTVPVIAVTSWTAVDQGERVHGEGFDRVLAKPCDFTTLFEAVAHGLPAPSRLRVAGAYESFLAAASLAPLENRQAGLD